MVLQEKRRTQIVYAHPTTGVHRRTGWSGEEKLHVLYSPVWSGTEITQSEGHPWPKDKAKGGDVGGEFNSQKAYISEVRSSQLSSRCYDSSSGTTYYYDGPVFARLPDLSELKRYWVPSTPAQLDAMGSTAIARTIPTNSAADTSVFLAEIMREGIPHLIGFSLLKSAKGLGWKAGSEYLNYQFGILPLISGIRDMAKAVLRSEEILGQLRRDSGRNVRRRWTFPIETTVERERSGWGLVAPWPNEFGMFSSGGFNTERIHQIKEIWFSGCYTYHFEMTDKSSSYLSDHARMAKQLLGLELTPEVLWNLAPWSWLIDWFSNVGDIFHNVSAFADDGLVLRYGYVMETLKRERITTTSSLRAYLDGLDRPYPHTLSLTEGYKGLQRRKATPYGFGLDLGSLDLRQWAILGALGMTKAPQTLR